MPRTLLSAILLLLVCIALIAGIEHYDRVRQDQQIADAITQQLRPFQERLQAGLDALIAENRQLADRIAAHPDLADPALDAIAAETLARQPRARSVVITRKLNVVFVHPTLGNEALIGLDYGLHPEFMGAINRAIASRDTVLDAPVRLLQTARAGLIVRTPVFAPDGELTALVSMAADLEGLLVEVGLLDPSLAFTPIIRQHVAGQPERALFGGDEWLRHTRAGRRIVLPDGE